jgi:PAS domain-containing protein
LIVLLARNMIEALDVPAYLTGQDGGLLAINQAAGELTGQRLDEFGRVASDHWSSLAPRTRDGVPLSPERLPVTAALRGGAPVHDRFHLRARDGGLIEVEATALPLSDELDVRGAVVVFWPSRGSQAG